MGKRERNSESGPLALNPRIEDQVDGIAPLVGIQAVGVKFDAGSSQFPAVIAVGRDRRGMAARPRGDRFRGAPAMRSAGCSTVYGLGLLFSLKTHREFFAGADHATLGNLTELIIALARLSPIRCSCSGRRSCSAASSIMCRTTTATMRGFRPGCCSSRRLRFWCRRCWPAPMPRRPRG